MHNTSVSKGYRNPVIFVTHGELEQEAQEELGMKSWISMGFEK